MLFFEGHAESDGYRVWRSKKAFVCTFTGC